MELIVFVILLGIGFFIGSYLESKHFIEIKQRERKSLHVPLMNLGARQALPYAHEAQLFVGSVVIANDYFKTFAASLHNLVGGRVVVYESLLDRGRREAVLRLKEQAMAWGASQVVNVRFETSNIGAQETRRGPAMVEVIAYGTGIR